MHRSLKPSSHAQAQAKKVPPPAIPGDTQHHQQQQQQQQQHIPLYRLGSSITNANDAAHQQQQQQQQQHHYHHIMSSSLVSSPSLEEGGFNLPRETTVALRMKDELTDYATTMSTSGGGGGGPSSAAAAAAVGANPQAATAAGTAATAGKQASVTATPIGVGGHAMLVAGVGGVPTNPLLGGCAPVAPTMPCPPPPIFCATLREPLTHKAAVYYHQQLALQEDQGIDLTQSPGRDSPGSSSGSAGSGSRHSTASLDSGRASSYLTGVSGASIRGSSGSGGGGSSAGGGSNSTGSSSGGGSAGGGALSSPRCSSLSSCSIGSVDRQRNDELIIDWLMEMKYEEYAQLFIAAGYDLPTIARMTPEDLTAIGIKNPHHRERIKQRIDKLQVLDNLPHFVPGSIEEWLQLLRLEEYIQPLLDQNYKTVRDVTQVTWEDLEDIGIVKLGHQKKILLAIKRVKDIISGKWNPGANIYQQQHLLPHPHPLPVDCQQQRKPWLLPVPIPTTPPSYYPTTRVSWDDSRIYATTAAMSGHNNSTSSSNTGSIGSHYSGNNDGGIAGNVDAYYCTGSNHECCAGNDVVLIKVRQPRGKSLESLEDIHDNSTRSHLTFSHYTTTDYGHFAHPAQLAHHQALQQHHQQQQHHHMQQQQHQAALMGTAGANRLLGNPAAMSWRRSYDDGDITPTNDAATAARDIMYEEGGGTLPRQQRASSGGILQRAVLNTMPPLEHHHHHHHHYMNAAAAAAEYVSLTNAAAAAAAAGVAVPGGVAAASSIGPGQSAMAGGSGVLDTSGLGGSYLGGSPMASKKIAPDPPRRHCSIRNSRTLSSDGAVTALQQAQAQQQQQAQSLHAQNLYYGGVGGGGMSSGVLPMAPLQHGPGVAAAYLQQQQQQQQLHQQQQPIYANYATIQQTTAEIHCEKFHDNKSNSSIDSIDTIPFANENTGTIKQRLLNRQDMSATAHNSAAQQSGGTHNLHSSSSSSSSSSTNTIANLTHSFHALKTSASLHDTATLIRSDSIGSNASGGSAGHPTSTAGGGMRSLLRSPPTLQYQLEGGVSSTITTTVDLHTPSSGGGGSAGGDGMSPDSEAIIGAAAVQSGGGGGGTGGGPSGGGGIGAKVSVNVLNDIGNMLANLTDELDAMLEEEKRAGLNIDSE